MHVSQVMVKPAGTGRPILLLHASAAKATEGQLVIQTHCFYAEWSGSMAWRNSLAKPRSANRRRAGAAVAAS